MFATLLTVTLFALSAVRGVLSFNMADPTVTQCADAHLTWDDTGAPPYNVIVVPADDTCGNALYDLGDHSMNHITWYSVPVAAGTQIVFSVEDASGNEAWSDPITVGASSNSSCLSSSSVVANAATGPSTTTAAAAAHSSSAGAVAAGAANAGYNPLSSDAPSLRQISIPVLAISVIAGAVTLFL